jgi:hypothetical protein
MRRASAWAALGSLLVYATLSLLGVGLAAVSVAQATALHSCAQAAARAAPVSKTAAPTHSAGRTDYLTKVRMGWSIA